MFHKLSRLASVFSPHVTVVNTSNEYVNLVVAILQLLCCLLYFQYSQGCFKLGTFYGVFCLLFLFIHESSYKRFELSNVSTELKKLMPFSSFDSHDLILHSALLSMKTFSLSAKN